MDEDACKDAEDPPDVCSWIRDVVTCVSTIGRMGFATYKLTDGRSLRGRLGWNMYWCLSGKAGNHS